VVREHIVVILLELSFKLTNLTKRDSSFTMQQIFSIVISVVCTLNKLYLFRDYIM